MSDQSEYTLEHTFDCLPEDYIHQTPALHFQLHSDMGSPTMMMLIRRGLCCQNKGHFFNMKTMKCDFCDFTIKEFRDRELEESKQNFEARRKHVD